MEKYSFENLRLLLISNGIDFEVITHNPVFTMEDVIRELNIPSKSMAKTILITTEDKGLLRIILPGMNRLDVKQLSLITEIPQKNIQFANKKTIEQTGFTIGAIPPFGGSFPTYIDFSLLNQEVLYCGAGDNNKTFLIKPQDIIRIASAPIVNVSKEASQKSAT
ncbi:MAG: YbaK/EbsC family protein [Minisyncoccales bacterium]